MTPVFFAYIPHPFDREYASMSALARPSFLPSSRRARLWAGSFFVAAILFAFVSVPGARAQSWPEVRAVLDEMPQLVDEALVASRAAEEASSIPDLKRHVDRVFEAVWGIPSGLVGERRARTEHVHGWKTRWQADPADYDSSWAARTGGGLAEIRDPRRLGIVGRGRYVRRFLEGIVADSTAARTEREAARAVLVPLSNVVGWMRLSSGLKGNELQPRVSLTHVYDYPAAFWQSTADTGWIFEAYSQASNILKTDYAGDLAEARRHTAGLSDVLARVLQGVDADRDGTVAAAPMEGGLRTALARAARLSIGS